jgi:hypothetical protein
MTDTQVVDNDPTEIQDVIAGPDEKVFGEFDWGGVKIDLDRIPVKVQGFLMSRGIIHKLGNEVAASVGKLKADYKPTETEPEFDEESVTKELREKMAQKILEGTIGLRIGGPRGDTIENIAYELAMKQAENTLAPKGYWPKADKKAGIKAEDATVEFNGRAMTREELADVVFEKYKEKFMEEARAEHKARMDKAKLAKANAVKPVSKVEKSIEDLL